MDYEIRPTSRYELRLYAKLFRFICGLTENEPIDPVLLLDRLPDLEGFENVRYSVVYNNELPGAVPAQCTPTEDGYLLQIKESVYNGAHLRRIGGSRMHIMHEIMHVYLDKLGFTPIYSRCLTPDVPPFRRLEWAVMAIAGEVMMPFTATEGMSKKDLMKIYGVSDKAAQKRLTY